MQSLSSQKLKNWWQSLSDSEKQQVSTIDAPEIMSDLANVANNALLVCKLHPDCKDKDLIVWKKAKTDNEGIVTHTFTLNLVEKSVLGKHLDDAFSSFSVFISREVRGRAGPRATKQANFSPKSCFSVKQEKLSGLLQLISNAISSQFVEKINEILLKTSQTPFEMYSSLIDFSSQNLFSDLSIPSYLKKLFDRFASCTFIIARKIHFSYCEANSLDPLAPQINEKLDQFFSMMSGLGNASDGTEKKPGLLFAKTVSQIEKERAQEESLEDQSTDNGNDSPKGSQREEELSGKTKFGVPVRSVPLAESFAFYEGCFLGDLEMVFDPSDCFTIEEEDPLQKFHGDVGSYYSEEDNDNNKEEEEEEAYEEMEQDQTGYYPQMGYIQPVYGYYPEYYQPAAYAGGYNMEGYYYGGVGYDTQQQHLRKKSFESQSSYGSDKENFGSQHSGNEGYEYDKFSYYKKKAPFDTRSKLPPRFQRKREGNFRV